MRTLAWLGVNLALCLPALLVAFTFLRRQFRTAVQPMPAQSGAVAPGALSVHRAPPPTPLVPQRPTHRPSPCPRPCPCDLTLACSAGVALALGGFALSALPEPVGDVMPFMGLLAASTVPGLFTARIMLVTLWLLVFVAVAAARRFMWTATGPTRNLR